ncbi:MAG TPA: peptide chain release factor N(5)-glutamine methyltransferase [Vicinamibacterales bacterium]|nr:peptide chain release factor N(5)-glutamine methyltransferase [Vicinamibacterales bacterium]
MTISASVAAARHLLREAGLSQTEADLDSRLLAQHVLGWETARFLTSSHEQAPDGFAADYAPLIARRASREPLPYITGHRDFWDLTFEVSPAVLIPRPETELIVEAALELFPTVTAPLMFADACTGSGVIAIALARERPNARVVATDISPDAIGVAQRNAAQLGVGGRVRFVCADLLEPVTEPVDLITCNPPYVAELSRPGLQPEVRDHEPSVALYGGRDGLSLVARTVAAAPSRLRPGGYLIFEFGCGQDVEVEALIDECPDLELVGLRRDLQGIARTAVARRR